MTGPQDPYRRDPAAQRPRPEWGSPDHAWDPPAAPGPWGTPEGDRPWEPPEGDRPWGAPEDAHAWGPHDGRPWGEPADDRPWGAASPDPWGPATSAPAASGRAPKPGGDPWAGTPLRGEEKLWVPAAHWLAIPTLWLGPLVILLTVGERNARVREHAKESLNFEVTVAIGLLASALLLFVGVGVIGLVVLPIAWLGLHIVSALHAARGEAVRYPLTLRLVR